jgi:hypothetical protein
VRSAWLCIPSARPPAERDPILKLWRDRGYKIALQCDGSLDLYENEYGDVVFQRTYQGYAEAVNYLSKAVLETTPEAQWIVCAGDDTEPDRNHTAEEIAAQCTAHFRKLHYGNESHHAPEVGPLATFGVMQPTGDRWGEHRNTHTFTPRAGGRPEIQLCSQCGRVKDNSIHMVGAYIDRVAGSPWIGREFALRANQGRGPLWPEYFHMGCDEELQTVATRLGVFWQRPDLIHLHNHWGREAGNAANMPAFLKRANSAEEWNKYKALFAERQAAGFPGSEPL